MLLWSAFRWTGAAKYLAPMGTPQAPVGFGGINSDIARDVGMPELNQRYAIAAAKPDAAPDALTFAAAETGDRSFLERLYAQEIQFASVRMKMQTEDQWWTDRVELPSDQLQRARLGGVAHMRNRIVPGNRISWRFDDPENALKVAVLVRKPAKDGFRVVVWNMSSTPIAADISGAEITPGQWRVSQGVDVNEDDKPDAGQTSTVDFGPGQAVPVILPPGASVIEFALTEAGPALSTRADVGIGAADLVRRGGRLSVTVHGLGAVASPAGRVVIEGVDGTVLATARFGPLAPPNDLQPKTETVAVRLPRNLIAGTQVRLVLDGEPDEISVANNQAALPSR